MKIERISDNQIKFVLTEDDLLKWNLKLNELSYGSEKTQELFREIMDRATNECDFHANEDTPLIIEAVPISGESIMIMVTKLSNQEDLESRLGYPPILDNFTRGARSKPAADKGLHDFGTPMEDSKKHTASDVVFEFPSLEAVVKGVTRISGSFFGRNMLSKYKNKYYLVFENEKYRLGHNQELILLEYGTRHSQSEMSKMFLMEHGEVIIPRNAVSIISSYLA